MHVDGGVADNLPFYPLIGLCRKIVIVKVNFNDEALGMRALTLTWQKINRIKKPSNKRMPFFLKCAYAKDLPYLVKNDPPQIIPFDKLEEMPEIITISPPKYSWRV